MNDVERTVAAQVEVYGEPLAEIFARLTRGLGLSQAGLARVLGMSAPMLSQLGSGHRAKIGNPAVQRRLEETQLLLDQVTDGTVAGDRIPERLDQIRESTGAWTTTRHDLPRGAADADSVSAALRQVAAPGELAAAAEVLDREHPGLAALLRAAAGTDQPQR